MNAKMTIALPLAIVSFVCGVYCAPTGENEFPSHYPLQNCKSDSPYLQFYLSPVATYDFEYNEQDPSQCALIQRMESISNISTFKRTGVEFVSMKDEQITLIMYPAFATNEKATWKATCDFASVTLAQKFYKSITQGRQSELVSYMTADYLLNSNNDLLAEPANIYLDCFEHDITIVVKNDKGDPVLIFPRDAISQTILPEAEPTTLDLYVSMNRELPGPYKFGFSTPSRASAFDKLLNTLRQPIPTTYESQNFRRPNRDPDVNEVFTKIIEEIPR